MRFDKEINFFDLINNEDEPREYNKISGSTITFVVIYVNDIIFVGNGVGMVYLIRHACQRTSQGKIWEKKLYWEYVFIDIH